MDMLSRHYHQLAGLNSDWAISHVQLDVQSQTLTLSLDSLLLVWCARNVGLSVP